MKEERIIKIKMDSGLSFVEARKQYEQLYAETSYANKTSAQNRLDNERYDNSKEKEIAGLQLELGKLKEMQKEMKSLVEEIKTLRTENCKLQKEIAQGRNKIQNKRNREIASISSDDNESPNNQRPQTRYNTRRQPLKVYIPEAYTEEEFEYPELPTYTEIINAKYGPRKKPKGKYNIVEIPPFKRKPGRPRKTQNK